MKVCPSFLSAASNSALQTRALCTSTLPPPRVVPPPSHPSRVWRSRRHHLRTHMEDAVAAVIPGPGPRPQAPGPRRQAPGPGPRPQASAAVSVSSAQGAWRALCTAWIGGYQANIRVRALHRLCKLVHLQQAGNNSHASGPLETGKVRRDHRVSYLGVDACRGAPDVLTPQQPSTR